MDYFKTICIYENLPILAYFFKKTGGFFSSIEKIHFQILFHVPNTFLILLN